MTLTDAIELAKQEIKQGYALRYHVEKRKQKKSKSNIHSMELKNEKNYYQRF